MKVRCLDPEELDGNFPPNPILEVSDEEGHSIKVDVPYSYDELRKMLATSIKCEEVYKEREKREGRIME